MLQELVGKTVSISLGSTEFSEAPKGEVIEIKDSWLKLQTKKNVQYIRIETIFKIALIS
jgi:hypothetical protein